MNVSKWIGAVVAAFLLAGLPASSNYQLNSYGFGSGGTAGSSSTNYKVNGISGDTAGTSSSTNYGLGVGENYVKQANVPTITIVNAAGFYSHLHVIIGPENNPSDALFAIAISTDNFATVTKYVKNDLTVSNTLTFADYQTYAAWGSGTGQELRGLAPNTVYTVKAKAYRGKYTESPYGPTSSAITTTPSVSFDIDVAATDISTSPPYVLDFGSIPLSTITTTPKRIWVSFDTNADSGGSVFLSGQNTGLLSAINSYTINSMTGDLATVSEGVGAQGVSATQTSGGPFTLSSPYDGSSGNVGIADTQLREIFSAPSAVSAGRGSFVLKAKTQSQTPASGDYTETLTAIASGNF